MACLSTIWLYSAHLSFMPVRLYGLKTDLAVTWKTLQKAPEGDAETKTLHLRTPFWCYRDSTSEWLWKHCQLDNPKLMWVLWWIVCFPQAFRFVGLLVAGHGCPHLSSTYYHATFTMPWQYQRLQSKHQNSPQSLLDCASTILVWEQPYEIEEQTCPPWPVSAIHLYWYT